MLGVERFAAVGELADQYKSGDGLAGDALAIYLRTNFVRRFSAMGIPPHDSEDLAQQCLVDIFGCIDRFDSDKGTMDAWASGVARNVLRNWWRRSKNMKLSEAPSDALMDLPAPQPVEEAATFAVSEAMSALSLIDKELLHMRFALGMSFSDIAASSDLTDANARKRVSRAVEQLRRQPSIQELLA